MFKINNIKIVDFINTVSYLETKQLAFNCYEIDLNNNMFDTLDKTYIEYKDQFKHSFKIDDLMNVYQNNRVIKVKSGGNIEECHYGIYLLYLIRLIKNPDVKFPFENQLENLMF